MLNSMDNKFHIQISDDMNLDRIYFGDRNPKNVTFFLTEPDDVSRVADPVYEQFLADVWVGIVLTLMVLSCVCCMCSCLLYHKFQQWKRGVMETRRRTANIESGQTTESESLPSYTIVSGLPSYDEALEQFRQQSQQSKTLENKSESDSQTQNSPITALSVIDLFQFYKSNNNNHNNFVSSSTDSKK